MAAIRRAAGPTALLLLLAPLVLGAAPAPPGAPAAAETSGRINAFAIDLVRQMTTGAEAPHNAVVSPHAVFCGLAMSYLASGGATREELARAVHFPADDARLVQELSELRRQLADRAPHEKVDVSLENSAWLDATYASFRPDYLARTGDGLGASLHAVRFEHRREAAELINRWVAAATRGRVQRCVSADDFESRSGMDPVTGYDTVDEPALVTVDAVYFKADWASRFDEDATADLPFHLDDTTTRPALMMHQRSLLPYAEGEGLKFLAISYDGGRFSMYVILPDEVLSVAQLAALVDVDTLTGLAASATPHVADVLLPRWEVRTHVSLRPVLSAMGVRRAFSKRSADFDRMIVKKVEAFRVYISEAYHDAWMAVDEQGTEAAAAMATVGYSFGCSAPVPPQPATFHADHPFLFFIVHNPSRSVLFAGWVSDPTAIQADRGPSPAQRRVRDETMTLTGEGKAVVARGDEPLAEVEAEVAATVMAKANLLEALRTYDLGGGRTLGGAMREHPGAMRGVMRILQRTTVVCHARAAEDGPKVMVATATLTVRRAELEALETGRAAP